VVRREPRLFGHSQSRWTLTTLAQSCDWLRTTTPSGLWQVLHRLKIHYKRGRSYIHSPDLYYEEKVGLIQLCLLRAWYAPEQYVFLYQDEFGYCRQPTLACAYEMAGSIQPLAYRSHAANTEFRITAALNVITGQVTFRQHSHIDLVHLSNFYADVRAAYPDAQEIYIAQDNWPIHFHPDVLARLQPQTFYPQPPKVPPNWPTEPRRGVAKDNLPIRLLLLPTYASWLNPIEKLWRCLNQNVLHLHRLSDDWPELKHQVSVFLDGFKNGSTDLLRYTGLLPS
jgi:hypothetical protein